MREKREGTQTSPRGDRCRQCDVWVSGGCDAVTSRVTCHAAVTELVTWLQTPDRDLHHTAVTSSAQSAARPNNHKMTRSDGGRREWHDMENGDNFTFIHHSQQETTFYIYMCSCLYFLPRLFLAQGDTEPFLVWSMSVLCHQHTCCSAADTRTSHDRLQMGIKTR